MSNEYYIVNEKGNAGPYDLVALIIKIRNRSLTPQMQIMQSATGETRTAGEWHELSGFFTEVSDKKEPFQEHAHQEYSLLHAVRYGLSFLQLHFIATLLSAVLVLCTIVVIAGVTYFIPDILKEPGYVAGIIVFYLLYSAYLSIILRIIRGQPIITQYVIERTLANFKNLVISALIVLAPVIIGIIIMTLSTENVIGAVIGLLIIIGPGIYMIAIYAFTPLLIIDKEYGVKEALDKSKKLVMSKGVEYFGIYFSLQAINVIAALLALIPMALTLPVTSSFIANVYDEHFS